MLKKLLPINIFMINFITSKKDLFFKYILTTLNIEEFKTLLWKIFQIIIQCF
jgi:hypothetical protein